MIKRSLLAVFALSASMAACAEAPYTEGKQYNVIASPLSGAKNNEVTEYFSVYCPHCYTLEGILPGITPHFDEKVTLAKSHVDFLRMADKHLQETFSRALIVAENVGKKQALIEAAFAKIHDEGRKPEKDADIIALMRSVGIEQSAIGSLNSFLVTSTLRRAQQEQQELLDARAIRGVPSLVVEGKYVIDLSQLDRANFRRDLAGVVNYLSALDGE